MQFCRALCIRIVAQNCVLRAVPVGLVQEKAALASQLSVATRNLAAAEDQVRQRIFWHGSCTIKESELLSLISGGVPARERKQRTAKSTTVADIL